MKKTYRSILILVTLIIFLIMCLIKAKTIGNLIIEYSLLFLTSYYPVSFIFFIISSLFISYDLIGKVNKIIPINASKIYIFLLSLISGFPSGAKYTKDLLMNKTISYNEAKKIIMFAHFPNPLFVLGVIGNIVGRILSKNILLSVILSNLIICIFIKEKSIIMNEKISEKDFTDNLTNSIKSSFETIMMVYGISLFFYLWFALITNIIPCSPIIYVLLAGLFDLTKGVFATVMISSDILKSILILIFISFGGISIHMQVKSILSDNRLYLEYIKGRFIGTFLAIIIFFILS